MANSKFSLIIAFFASLFISGCTYKAIPLKGTYLNKPFEVISTKSKEQVWENLIDFFATGGLSIKLIDKSSGLIISDRSVLTYTYEDKHGELMNPAAWVVAEKFYNKGANKIVAPTQPTVTGDWNVFIKELPTGGTSINVNLVNIRAYTNASTGMNEIDYTIRAKSTGNFEKKIAEIIK